jgi:TPR repeat protein
VPPGPLLASIVVASALAACARTPTSWAPVAPAAPACPAGGCTAEVAARITSARTPDACPGAGEAPCAGAAAHDCTVRALAAWADAQDDRQVACVARVLSDACSLGDAAGCTHAGRLWLDGRAVTRDPERGLDMLAKGCEGGVLMSCMVAVRWLADERRAATVKDGATRRVRLDAEATCLAGSAEDCATLGQLYYAGRDPYPRDRARSAVEYQRGCDLGSTVACSNLGDAYEYGEAVVRDLAHAAALYERACHAGSALGCANLGHLVEHGEGVARDPARARTLYRDACDRGDVYGCLHAQLMVAEPGGPPADPARSLERWRRACDRRDARACAFVGLIYEDGPDGFARDEAKSLQAMGRACDLGLHAGCDWLQSHGGQ